MEQRESSRPAPPPRKHTYVYERTTGNIRVAVKPAYLDDQSDPSESRYVWSYAVTIENLGTESVQVISRYWHITDARGHVQEVRGPGVVGEQPVLEAGQAFEYSSGCPLPTPSGAMVGRYQLRSASGESLEADIPMFLLESPYERRQIH
ncbi:MAG TPA: Co2+/Mg2+ efflux protein ApaG [Rhizomicrobium sp.]|jgi:ApaG protein